MHVYIWEHIVSLYCRTVKWMFTKLGTDEVLIAAHMGLGFGQICPRADPGQGKNRSQGGGGPFLTKTSSHWKATATNRMHNNVIASCIILHFV